MTKRGKQKTSSAFKSHQSATISLQSILRDALTFPVLECWIAANWGKDSGLAQIILARQQPNGKICCGVYLIDIYCLGLKNTFVRINLSRERYEEEVYEKISETQPLEECPIELAHQMIYEGIDYAAQFGFKPQYDWKDSQYMLSPRGELEEPYDLTFGKDGKPFFVAGPHDNVKQILKQLDETAGPGNYHYITMIR